MSPSDKVHYSEAEVALPVNATAEGGDPPKAFEVPSAYRPIGYRDSPLKTLWNDTLLVFGELPWLPFVLLPLRSLLLDMTWRGILYQVVATSVTIVVLPFILLSFFYGLPWPIVTTAALIATFKLCDMVQGDKNIIKPTKKQLEKAKGAFSGERWFFVNGVATSPTGNRKVCNRLFEIFGRPVYGISNRSNGVLFDLIECLLQRDLRWPTRDERVGYNALATWLGRPDIERVVLIGHSQGGILCSNWADQLLSDFSRETLSKLEIYTFAAAANHFPDPSEGEGPNKITSFGRLEHFANEGDMVARIGVLAFRSEQADRLPGDGKSRYSLSGPFRALFATKVAAVESSKNEKKHGGISKKVATRFAGKLFVRKNRTGHLMAAHYLYPGDSILDLKTVQQESRLQVYKNGGAAIPGLASK